MRADEQARSILQVGNEGVAKGRTGGRARRRVDGREGRPVDGPARG